MSDADLLSILHQTATAVADALAVLDDWGPAGTRDGQYRHDLVADRAALSVLQSAGLSVISEESGLHGSHSSEGLAVVLDPVDGSTNASRGIPWFNTSLCAVEAGEMRAALVVDQVGGHRYEATRGGGARRDGEPIAPSRCTAIGDAIIGLNGYSPHHLGWKQYRALGSAALDLCAVASGILDGYVDCTEGGLATWDYLGGALICQEAGASVTTITGAPLVGASRQVVVAAGSAPLLAELVSARLRFAIS